ncbi:hypothetical protein [Spirosoma montaniterrae]|uniref:Uncharacterized protein n=1 Tax=Spirosoma montaniterrae TaxID=1178516 RepID=A0A1P9WY40_9BACT|nr:hypothetical protein [Spirosoma montaniterrae]AQG80289.1 hypothetical protein AWR27_13755 [Spirosoma montaniterrae]
MRTLNMLNAPDGLKNWEKRFPGFVSLNKSYTNLVKYDIGKALEDGTIQQYEGVYTVKGVGKDRDFRRALSDFALANLVNAKGLVQVGDILIHISDVAVSRTHLRYEQELLRGSGPHVVSRAVDNLPTSVNIKTPSGARRATVDDYWDIPYNSTGLVERRFRGNTWAKNYPFPQQYWSTGVEVRHQRSNWWGWGAHPSDGMSVSGSATLNGNPISPWYEENHSETIRWRYQESWTSGSVGTVTMNATFRGVCNGNGGSIGKNRTQLISFSTNI